MSDVYGDFDQLRVAVAAPDTWTALTIPQGAKNALLQLEDITATMRVSAVDTIAPATEGGHVAPRGGVSFAGTAVAPVLIYVASDKGPTTAILLYTQDAVP